ncbi:MAG: type II toxin-antitoxin system Phd/YefM family antitoxin [bacterium]|nr:type II toxin-antitoxin system Phd/YefM family antitoxin [bacterium]
MTSTNMTGLHENLSLYVNQAVEFSDVINVSTENGNAIIISEADYNALLETLYLSNNPKVRKEILDGKNTPIDECIPENEVEW